MRYRPLTTTAVATTRQKFVTELALTVSSARSPVNGCSSHNATAIDIFVVASSWSALRLDRIIPEGASDSAARSAHLFWCGALLSSSSESCEIC